MDSIDVTPNQRNIIDSLLRRHIPGVTVWAYGSRVKWTSRPDSDLDLIAFTSPEQQGRISALKEAFEESSLPLRIDVMVWDDVPESFRKNILEQYVVLAEKPVEKPETKARSLEWKVKTLDSLGRIVTGKTPSSQLADCFGGDIPFVTPSDMDESRIIDRTSRYLTEEGAKAVASSRIPANAVMVSCIGSDMGKAALAGRNCFTNQQINSIIVNADNDPLFVYYNLKARKYEVLAAAGGSAVPILNKSSFGQFKIVLPPRPEQRAIAHILGTLDDKFELNRRMNETLESMARALFKSWFVDFEPVRAKAEGRDTGLPQVIADLFPDSFEDSELGEVPKGWSVGTLGDVALLNPESWSKNTRPDVISYVDLSNTKWGYIEAVTNYALNDAPSRAQRVLRPLDTIVGTVRPGNGSYAFIAEDGLTGSTGFAVLRPRKVVNAEFIYLAATSSENIEALTHLADGGAYPAVRPEVVAASQVIIPDDNVLTQFSLNTSNILARIASNERESRTLAMQRDVLMPKLLSGEIRITEAEKLVAAAV